MLHPHHLRSHTRGYVLVLAIVFFGISLAAAAALIAYVSATARFERSSIAQSQALSLAEGALDLAVYNLNQNPSYMGEANTTLGEGQFTIGIATVDSRTRRVTATACVPNCSFPNVTKTIKANIGILGDAISFHYGIQSGQGGFYLENSSSVIGNVYSGGSVVGTSQNYIRGSVVSAGPSGLVYGIHATSSVYAHTIGNASRQTIIDKDAYYATTKTNTTVTGTSYPGSPDQPIADLPISDDQIAEWEDIAAAGGTATCSGGSYTISSGTVTIGPKKIPCDLNVTNSATLVVTGHLWITGDIAIKNSAIVKMDPSLGANNVAIIADNPSDQVNSSTISVQNSATFQNSGTAGSFVFLISQNRSAEQGGGVTAIDLGNSASAMVAYAAHGLIPLANSVSLKEVTAYKITMKNSAVVKYDSGLPSTVFESGPGGSWSFVPGSYAITQ